jgi:hypothetical protein
MSVHNLDVIRATARMKWAGVVDVQNTFTAVLGSGTSISDEDAKDDLAAWLEDMYTITALLMPTNLTFEDIDYFNLTQDAPMGTLSWPTLVAGNGATTEIAATGVCAVITAFTNVVRVHGRKFFGPLVETVIDAGYLNSTVMTGMAGVITLWITPFTGTVSGETWAPGVWQRLTGTFKTFRDAVIRNVPGYQRRRKAGVGS